MQLLGPVFAQMYGQSETGIPVTFMSSEAYIEALAGESKHHRLASCAKQSLHFEALEIVDEDD